MIKATVATLAVAALLAGCSSKDDDLQAFIDRTNQEQPGGVVDRVTVGASEEDLRHLYRNTAEAFYRI